MAAKSKKTAEPAEPVAPAESALPAFSRFSYEEFVVLGRENVEAAVKANAALSAGMEAIGQEVVGYTRTALESAGETVRALLAARTFEDFVRLQTELAQRNFAGIVAGSAKLSELGAALADEAFEPWGGRVEATLAQFTKPLAA